METVERSCTKTQRRDSMNIATITTPLTKSQSVLFAPKRPAIKDLRELWGLMQFAAG